MKNGEFLIRGRRLVAGGQGSFDVRCLCKRKRGTIKVLMKIQ
jgi:hypothetical protein